MRLEAALPIKDCCSISGRLSACPKTKKAVLLEFLDSFVFEANDATVGEKKPGLAGLLSYSKDFFLLSLYIPFVLLSSTEH